MTQVGYVREADFASLVFRDLESGDVIEIQRAVAIDAQDRALGLDTYCVVRAGVTHYGGLLAWSLGNGVLALTLSDSAAAVLELPESPEIPVDEEGAALVRAYLGELLA